MSDLHDYEPPMTEQQIRRARELIALQEQKRHCTGTGTFIPTGPRGVPTVAGKGPGQTHTSEGSDDGSGSKA